MSTAMHGLMDASTETEQRDDRRFVALAAQLGREFAQRAAHYDETNTFVRENFEALKASGYMAIAVPEELGGLGATLRQMVFAQAELARYCGATALAVNMHIDITATNVYRWKHGMAAAEGLLRKVAADKLILMTSGGTDGLWPAAMARRVEGGYRVTGRKVFCSQAPIANVLTTMAVYEDPDDGRIVLAMGIPMTSAGVRIVETWDTLGMRATGSHDVQLDDVFVSDAQIAARRPWGAWDPVMSNAVVHAGTLLSAVYYGIAAGARDEAVRLFVRRPERADDPAVIHQVGLMDAKLGTSWWGLLGYLSELSEDYAYPLNEPLINAGLIAKRQIVTDAVEVVDLAMEVAGRASYFKRSPLERAYRDVRAGKYHPLPPEKTLVYAGRLALGLPVASVW